MKRDVVKVDAVASCKCGCVCHASSRACSDATSSDLRSTTPAPPKMRECDEAVTPPRSAGSRRDLNSSCKRRRLASDDENIDDKSTDGLGAVRKLIYEKNDSDSSDDFDDEDLWEKEKMEFLQERILMQMKRVNCEYDEDQLLHTASSAKLFEFVTWCDVVEGKWYDGVDKEWVTCAIEERGDVKGQWVCRGVGCCKFIKCLEEGYNCGMIRLELTKNGTLETLMRHELTNEEATSMPSKRGKAYTWVCKDWAFRTMTRTFAIRFDDEMDALKWKNMFEQSKMNNCRVRRGLDIPDVSDVDDVCSIFQKSTTLASPSSKK